MTDDVEAVPERGTYLGRRETQGARLGALRKTSDGEELLFNSKRLSKVVGAVYEVTVYRNPQGVSIGASPTFAGAPNTEDTDISRWEAEDRAAATADALRKAEAKAHRASPERFGELTLAELRETYLRQAPLRGAALIGQVPATSAPPEAPRIAVGPNASRLPPPRSTTRKRKTGEHL